MEIEEFLLEFPSKECVFVKDELMR